METVREILARHSHPLGRGCEVALDGGGERQRYVRARTSAGMPGLVFFRTADRERTAEFYTDRLNFEEWLEQDGGCTILRRENLLVGFCGAETTETEGIVTVAVENEAAVDELYAELSDIADGPPTRNEAFDIYQFFATDPDGRTVEIQAFLHPTPPVG